MILLNSNPVSGMTQLAAGCGGGGGVTASCDCSLVTVAWGRLQARVCLTQVLSCTKTAAVTCRLSCKATRRVLSGMAVGLQLCSIFRAHPLCLLALVHRLLLPVSVGHHYD